jgi:hypothetical protein
LDHSSVTSSPRLIAGSYVLHRLLVPRHPPCALTNLATKMLASTVQFSSYGRSPPHTRRLPTHPTPPAGARTRTSGSPKRRSRTSGPPTRGSPVAEGSSRSPIPQDPTACQAPTHPPARSHPHPPRESRSCTRDRPASRRQLTDVPPLSTLPGTLARGRALDATPRKGPAPDAP